MKRIFVLALVIGMHVAAPRPMLQSVSAAGGLGAPSTDDTLVERFLHSDQPPLTTYRARRTLQASTRGGKMAASLEAWTHLDSDGTFGFEVIREAGSGLIRERVLVKALETERRNHNERATGEVMLSRVNYDFDVRAAAGDTVKIGLLPRRRSPMLLVGTVTVTRDGGDMLRIDGSLSEEPSWWTRRVDIVRRYARMNGVRVPVEMSSRADVRIVGDSSFSMTYDYAMINGRSAGLRPSPGSPGDRQSH
ncbi:MAG: hypothetical protein ACRD3C_20735 [Vicinamibacterales bacterium]